MFKWINKRRFPLGSVVHVEYTNHDSLGNPIVVKTIGNVVGYPTGFTLLVNSDEYDNFQTVDTSNCTIIPDPLAKYPPL